MAKASYRSWGVDRMYDDNKRWEEMKRASTANQQKEIFELHKLGLSMNKISKQLRIAYGTVYNYVSKLNIPDDD